MQDSQSFADLQCPHLKQAKCIVASEIAKVPCETNEYVCKACSECDRPRRFNRYTATLIQLHNPAIDILSLSELIASGENFGSRIAATLDLIVPHDPACGCPGRQDILDTWTPDYIRHRMEDIIDWLQEEAHRRKLPFSRILTKTLLILLLPSTE